MGNMGLRRGLRGGFLALMLVVLAAGSALGVTFDLTVDETTLTMPDGRQVPAWGFGLNGGPITVPGPVLTVPPGEGAPELTINLTNNLLEPVSLHILGQILTNNTGPVWTDGTTETPIATGTRPAGNFTARVRSFSHETAPGATGTYVWSDFRPGTYLLESGTNPAKQCQMGLRLVVKQDFDVGGEAYPGVVYDQELVVVVSDVDPEMHDAIAGGYYGANAGPAPAGKNVITSSVYRQPHYFLINGMAFPNAALDPINGLLPIDPGQNVLLRFANAGTETRLPQMPEIYMDVVAEDGNPYAYPKPSYGFELPAGSTKDAVIQSASPAALRLFDGRLGIFNGAESRYGGMLTYIKVSDATQQALSVTPPAAFLGSVQSASLPGGVYCGIDCDESYNDLTEVRLAATTVPTRFFAGSQLNGWTGDGVTVGSDRVITMDQARAVTVNFQKLPAIGVFRGGTWLVDTNGNRLWDGLGIDTRVFFGASTDRPVTGDWDGDGITDIGVFSNATWYLDMDGDGQLNTATDRVFVFGLATDIPMPGDWNGDGITDFGLFRPSTASWYLDANGNGIWEGPAIDKIIVFGLATDIPVTGDWNGDGITDIGLFRNGTWYLDSNGNGLWNTGVDAKFVFGVASDIPVTGNWNNDANTEVGVFRNAVWYLDADGNRLWNLANDLKFTFGVATDIPVTGR